VNDVERCTSLVDEIQKEYGSLSILVNNAGITQDQLAMRMKEEDWDNVITTNLNSVARLSRAVLRGMMKAKHGRIINITSVVGSSGNPGQMNYAAAKAGVAGMSRALAREIGSRNITVNCIAPGFIDTDMTKALTDEQKAAILCKSRWRNLVVRKILRQQRSFWRRQMQVILPVRPFMLMVGCTWHNLWIVGGNFCENNRSYC
jgi:3-oxoacyl-[acyl-carrier protein] reductase